MEIVDYRQCDNPYLSKFGEDEWESRIWKCSLLRNVLPVSDLITHMAKSTTEAMKETEFEGRGYFYHDALTQLTEKETTNWMKQNEYDGRTYWSMWIRPVLGCNDSVRGKNDKLVTCYSNRPVGNMPEAMCLDNSLIQDVHTAVESNVGATYFLSDNDERKFSLTTPHRIISAYKRVFCPTTGHSAVPSSHRIIQDITKVVYALKCIVKANGNVVRGLASREGHRRWVEEYEQRNSIAISRDDGDNRDNDGVDGADEASETRGRPWLHHDTKYIYVAY